LLRAFRFLVHGGLPHAIAAACLRHQMLPKIVVRIGTGFTHIGNRGVGSLTGSRIAGMAARVPIQHACCTREPYWRQFGFLTPSGRLTMSTYVDNLFVAGRSCHGVTCILDDVEVFLESHWGLAIKPSSRLVMAPRHAADTSVSDESKWPVVSTMRVLGHYLEYDGSTDFCFNTTVRQCWRAFFGNCTGRLSVKMPVPTRVALLAKAVVPILRFRWARWPFTASRGELLDGIQRRMLAIILRIRIEPDETPERFCRRRAREISALQRKCGYWSKMWAFAVVGWSEHLERPRNSSTWASRVAAVRTPGELAQRRATFGRPQTRIASGFIRRRWWESIDFAKETLNRD